jgi:predicted ArsR family transcriptional regulator
MSRSPTSRAQLLDLLRPPQAANVDMWSTALTVDPKAQLREVADLVEQGFVSAAEFDSQRRKIADA